MPTLDDATLRQLFLDARTHIAWQNRPVDDVLLRRIYELARMGPTAMNIQPLRLVFVKSAEAKERLRPALPSGNVEKAMTAAATAIVAWDFEFFTTLNRLAPRRPEAGALGGDARRQAGAHGRAERHPAGGLPHPRRAEPGPGLRADGRLRRRRGRPGVPSPERPGARCCW